MAAQDNISPAQFGLGTHVRATSGYHGGKEGHIILQDGGNVKVRDVSGNEFLTGKGHVEATGSPAANVAPPAPSSRKLTEADVPPGTKVHLPGGKMGVITKVQRGPHSIPGVNVQYPGGETMGQGFYPHWHPIDGLRLHDSGKE